MVLSSVPVVNPKSPLPSQTNNPFSLIQSVPSRWQGLIGKLGDNPGNTAQKDFLVFDTPANGARAGFVNLVNTYINTGLNTILKIFPVYAPSSDSRNNPTVYAQTVANLTGLKPDEIITRSDQIYKVGQGIVKVEQGSFWISQADFDAGFKSAMLAKGIKLVATIGAGFVATALLFFLVLKVVKKKKEKENV